MDAKVRLYEKEFADMEKAYERAGGNPDLLKNPLYSSLVISGNKVLGKNELPGIKLHSEPFEEGVRIRLVVDEGVVMRTPVHLCFGLLGHKGTQRIDATFEIGRGSRIKFLAHCIFPNAVKIVHKMDAEIFVDEDAHMEYFEEHFHGELGGVEVIPRSRTYLKKGATYISEFKLVQGAIGFLDADYEVFLGEDAVTELTLKAYGKSKDRIRVRESLYLEGSNSRGIAKTRIVLQDEAKAEVLGEAVGRGPYSRGHVDCTEILRGDRAQAEAIPKLIVYNDLSKLTHEAAIGSIDRKELETLMARGLTEDEAVNTIVRGILR